MRLLLLLILFTPALSATAIKTLYLNNTQTYTDLLPLAKVIHDPEQHLTSQQAITIAKTLNTSAKIQSSGIGYWLVWSLKSQYSEAWILSSHNVFFSHLDFYLFYQQQQIQHLTTGLANPSFSGQLLQLSGWYFPFQIIQNQPVEIAVYIKTSLFNPLMFRLMTKSKADNFLTMQTLFILL